MNDTTTNLYKKMRVMECRANLVEKDATISDRDATISRLMQELEAANHGSISKDQIINERKAATHQMSQDLQKSRRECNDMLADQRAANEVVMDDSQKKVRSICRDCESTVANFQQQADEKITIAEQARDIAVADAKKCVLAERKFCQERCTETTTKVNEKLSGSELWQGPRWIS